MREELNSKKILEKLKKEKNKLKKNKVRKIGLFGSYLKGNQKNKSDIDFLVEFKEIDIDNYFDVLFLLENLFRKKVDLVIEKNLVPELKYVKREAKYVEL